MAKTKKLFSLAGIALISILFIAFLIYKGVIVLDHSGERFGDGLYWNNMFYTPCTGEYAEGRTIAKTKDGWQINEIEGDSAHTFLVLRSFLDQYLLVKKDYKIPHSGEITTALWNDRVISDKLFYKAISEILKNSATDFKYKTDAIFALRDNQKMGELCVGYDGCPIAFYRAYMGTVDGTWYITTEVSSDQYDADGAPKPYKISCYTIPQEYIEILGKYFF